MHLLFSFHGELGLPLPLSWSRSYHPPNIHIRPRRTKAKSHKVHAALRTLQVLESCTNWDWKTKEKERSSKSQPSNKHRENWGPRFSHLTLLKVNGSWILEEVVNVNLILAPHKLSMPLDADTSKKCRYHHNFNNTTKECLVLKYKIKELICEKYLHRLIKQQGNHFVPHSLGQREERPRQTRHQSRIPQRWWWWWWWWWW